MLKSHKEILKKLKQKKRGFTLLEIVVALAIIGIIIVPLGGALLTSVKTNKMGEIKQESKLISQEIIEKIRSYGDIKENMTFSVGGNKADLIDITKSLSNSKLYDIKGTLIDSNSNIMVEGTITEVGDFKEEHGSLKYLNQKFGLFVHVENKNNNNRVSFYKNNTSVSDPKAGTIDDYLKNPLLIKQIENCTELNIEIGGSGNKNKLVVNGQNVGTLITTGSSGEIIGEIGIYVEGQRDQTNLVDLKLNNKNPTIDGVVELYFFNNKFHPIGHDETIDPITDSFKRDRYINGEFKIFDNIKYYKEPDRLNKGLYTISLEFKKKIPNGITVTEKTQSEFMVDD